MADIYDEEYVNRKLAEVIHCKTCGQLMTPELQQWSWQHLGNGNRKWRRVSPHCKPCLSAKSLKRYKIAGVSEKQKLKRLEAQKKAQAERYKIKQKKETERLQQKKAKNLENIHKRRQRVLDRIERQRNESMYCKTCNALTPIELQQWSWQSKCGEKMFQRISPHCKPCLDKKRLEKNQEFKKQNEEAILRKKAEAAAKRQEQRRKQTEERIERQKKESFICKTCGELTPPELHQWSKVNSCNGKKRWKRSAHCKPCLSQKSLQNQTKDPQKYKKIKERQREYRRILQQTNPEKFKNDKRKTKVRRVARQLKQSDGSVTQEECYRILNSRNDCLYCGAILDKENRSLDHLEPLSKGGLHSTANLVVCCRTCNIKKRDTTFDSWVKKLPASRSKLAKSVYNKQIGNSKQLQLFTGSFG